MSKRNALTQTHRFRTTRFLLTALALLLVGAWAWAIQPGRWVHTTEADFAAGKTENTVVTNLNDVKLAAGTVELQNLARQAGIVYDLATVPGGDIYIAAGPETKLLRRRAGQVEQVLSLNGQQVFALRVDGQGRLLVGVSGEDESQLALLENDKLRPLVRLPGVRYIWDMLVDGSKVYVATGIDGKLLQVDLARLKPEAAQTRPSTRPTTQPRRLARNASTQQAQSWPEGVTQLLDATQANLLCLGRDGGGRLYVGTDTDGLVYRLTLKASGEAEPFVLYDAPEPEIGALLVMPDGTVYAGTADAEQARPGRLAEATAAEAGRPEVPSAPEAAPPPPKPSDLPQVPPQPEPIKPGPDRPKGSPSEPDQGDQPAAAKDRQTSATAPAKEQAEGEDEPDQSVAASSEQPDDRSGETPAPDGVREAIRLKMQATPRPTDAPDGAAPAPPRRPRGPITAPATGRGPQGPARPSMPPTGEAAKPGNGIYRIDSNGFVREIFRESVMVLKIVEDSGSLLVATGNEGRIYRLDPAAEETTVVADLETQQVTAMLVVKEPLSPSQTGEDRPTAQAGTATKQSTDQSTITSDQKSKIKNQKSPSTFVLLGTANAASLVRLQGGYAHRGIYTSVVLDASQISLWGKMHLLTTTPPGTSVSVQTRSGNVQDVDHAAWSPWSEPTVIDAKRSTPPLGPVELTVTSPPARFLQYRLTLVGDGQVTPVADRVEMAYVMPNLKPVVSALRVSAPGAAAAGSPPGSTTRGMPGLSAGQRGAAGRGSEDEPAQPSGVLSVDWETTDPNNDRLTYKLEHQPAGTGKWLLLAEDLDDDSFEWQTRRVPDGRYLLRVTASDSPDNPGSMAKTTTRVSDPVVVDNTPPAFEGLKHQVQGQGQKRQATITATVADQLLPIRAVAYSVDGAKQWTPVLPDDSVLDSTRESITVTISALVPGSHVVTLRASDTRGNNRYEALLIEAK